MTDVTLRDVLAMPVLRAAEPVLLTGADGLDRRVRWVHATELPDIAPLLRGGDLVLTTGIALPEAEAGLRAFAESLAEVSAAGLMVELGRRWSAVPDTLVAACAEAGLPLVCLQRVTRFAGITQAVGERVVDEQLAELREAERVHETFTALSLAEADPGEILAAVQRLAGATVVLESEQHQVVDYLAGPDDPGELLDGWTTRSGRVPLAGRTTWDEQQGWLLTRLGPRERGWGRLVVLSPRPPSQRLVAIAERGAAALALHRLHDRDRDNLVRRTHHELLLALQTDPAAADVVRRCELAGLPTTRRSYVGLTIRPRPDASRRSSAGEVLAAVVHAAHEAGLPALICEMDHDVRVLLAVSPTASEAVVDRLATALLRRHSAVVGAGRPAASLATADRTLRESRQVVDAVRPDRPADRPVHRLEDVHLRGLLTLLADDDRLRLFVARELEPLREHDAVHGTELVAAVRALLLNPAGKAQAAASLHLSRPAYYARLAKAEAVLGERLDDPDIRVSLHAALVAAELGV
ncbi:PucR family transcriptional regulator [Nocardioides lianchengensis]|uniref:Purine catabolism regulatory protein n=1 Tax=Nocardioides lianchengensis TaxID=1045774 RepID=A0A1G6PR19_9ACTN|nr:PucR family transcriptional regulator [Nocardioides lianchengensis]NYG11944.1 purine catabolism regulator [Nocardioides lianchengensis]SDC82421.1 purine catabolism regulatory protein [Nocardioides lianchengensis]